MDFNLNMNSLNVRPSKGENPERVLHCGWRVLQKRGTHNDNRLLRQTKKHTENNG